MRVLTTEKADILRLDKKDKRILGLYCKNVRLPMQKIATAVELTRHSVDYRIKQMEKNQLITGYRTVVNVQQLGYWSYHYFVLVTSEAAEKSLVKRCMQHDHVNALVSYSGAWNLEISIMARDPLECQQVFNELIDGIDIREYSVSTILRTLKSSVLPMVEEFDDVVDTKGAKGDASFSKQFLMKKISYDPDEKDIVILKELAGNSQATLKALGKTVGLTDDAIRYRIQKLIRSKYIIQFRPAINFDRLKLSIQTILIKVGTRTKENDKKFSQFLQGQHDVLWAAELMGSWDYVVYVINKDQEQIHELLSDMRNRFDTYIHSYEILFAYNDYKYSFMAQGITL